MARIIVDGANVVGSRPDGWWRDRSAAAARLAGRLEALTRADPSLDVVLVLEGAARRGTPSGRRGRLEVIHAEGSGDDEIARQAARTDRPADIVVTADRELRLRVSPLRYEGPSWLLSQLDGLGE